MCMDQASASKTPQPHSLAQDVQSSRLCCLHLRILAASSILGLAVTLLLLLQLLLLGIPPCLGSSPAAFLVNPILSLRHHLNSGVTVRVIIT